MEKITGYTIESTSAEGVYYLVNGWYKHFAFWIRKKDYSYNIEYHLKLITFKTIGSAKTNLKKLVKIMPDYANDRFRVCAITESGNINPISDYKIAGA